MKLPILPRPIIPSCMAFSMGNIGATRVASRNRDGNALCKVSRTARLFDGFQSPLADVERRVIVGSLALEIVALPLLRNRRRVAIMQQLVEFGARLAPLDVIG